MPSRPALIFDPRFRAHDPTHLGRAQHPESPARYDALVPVVEAAEGLSRLAVSPLDLRRLEGVHEVDHVARLSAMRGQTMQLDPDTSVGPDSTEAAWTAAAALITAVDASLAGEHAQSFCLVRPPGHHARPGQAMGFCLFNNVAVAAAHARAQGLERVCVIDWDVHPGNGTAEIFESDPSVLVVDLHQADHWPGTGGIAERGRGEGRGATLNLPMPIGANDGDAAAAFEQVVVPKVRAFDPQLILISAGFDAHRDDPLGELALTEYGFADLCARSLHLAREHAQGRLVLTLEGGYAPQALADSVQMCLETLAGQGPTLAPAPTRAPTPQMQANIERSREIHDLHGAG